LNIQDIEELVIFGQSISGNNCIFKAIKKAFTKFKWSRPLSFFKGLKPRTQVNHLVSIQKILNLPPSSIVSASSYFQRKTLRKEACQIDLLIKTRLTVYVCEIKFSKKISRSVIDEKSEKIWDDNFFSHLISFSDLLEYKFSWIIYTKTLQTMSLEF